MAAFSNAGQKLLESVTVPDLRDSLTLIRRAMEKIWAGDMPRIIQDDADRGAILDEDQQRTLAELRRKRAEDEQRKAAEEAAAAEPPKKPRARRKKPAAAE